MPEIKNYLSTFVGDLRVSFLDLAAIIGVISFFQFVILRSVPEGWPGMLLGLAIVGVGLALFMRGLEIGIFPLGEELAKYLASAPSRGWLIAFAFIIGFATTIAEPALIAVAHKAAAISDGQIDALILRMVVALSVGFAIVIGVIRILLGHPIHWYIIAGYVGVMFVTYFAPPEIVGLAYDSGGVTTSTVTVPLVAALGIGLASTLKNRNPIIDGFGLIAFASLTPMIFVQVYGIFAYSLGETAPVAPLLPEVDASVSVLTAAAVMASKTAGQYLDSFIATIRDVAPIIISILFFYLVVIRKPVLEFGKRVMGTLFIVFGLYAFVIGLEAGLFPIGETIAAELAKSGNVWLIYLFAFTIGFATTIAEPALTAIARKAEEVSGRAVKALALRIFVAVGVGVGIFLGTYRIIHGDSIVLYILVGYVVVILLTYFAPRTIIPIAYDSGGVTTSTVTVPIVAALGLGLAAAIPGRDPLIDGFGLIAFASLFPMISVLGYGIAETGQIRLHEKRIARMESQTMTRVLGRVKTGDDTQSAEKNAQGKRRLQKKIITITGASGSGVSSAAREVSRKLHYRHFSSGDLLRKIAQEFGVSIEKLNALAEGDEAIDREVDELTRELGEYSSKLVIDSRLGYHWIHDSFKVYLAIDRTAAAERVLKLAKQGERVGERAESFEEVYASMEKRAESQQKRYRENYGLDITNTKPFDLVIDTGKHDLDTVVAMIVEGYRAWYGEDV